ncbi:hypothetical protein C5D36_09810 [Rathayibacter sp. AY1C6]|nr:hypothetical protein C5D36_09810 [Rathayibacter sp. AY1C6]PPG28158.1 hypothetical protein C5C25_12735 [Rathayibacter sp. AY2B9]
MTRRLLRKKTRLATVTVIAALSVATLLASLTIEFGADLAKVWNDLDGRKWVFIICAAASAICLFTKEVWTTIARASDVKDQPDLVERFEDHAALCSLIATILGAPVVVAGLVELVVK